MDAIMLSGRVCRVTLGGVMVHITLGTVYTFGNLSPYLTSYLRHSTRDNITYSDSVWIYACNLIGHGLSMFLGGVIYRQLGLRPTVLLGSWLMSAGVMLTFFTVQHSFLGVIMTYGIVNGFGVGVAYSLPMACAMKWLPERKGLAGGLVVAGFGGGGFIFNLVQTAFINPGNLPTDLTVNDEKYFTQPEVLERVPWVFVLTGGLYAAIQLVGVLLISEPPQVSTENTLKSVSPVTEASASLVSGANHTATTQLNDDTGLVSGASHTATMQLNDDTGLVSGANHMANTQLNDDTGLVSGASHTANTQLKDDTGLVPGANNMATTETNENINDVDMSSVDVTPVQVLQTRHFYIIWMCFLLNGQGVVFILTLYKDYGQTFIQDDIFLAVTGAFAALLNCLGRLFWGFIGDRFSYNTATACLCSLTTGILITFHATSLGGKPLYFIYVCLMFGTLAGNFALFSLAVTTAFGQTHYPINYGFVFTSQAISAPLGAILASHLKTLIGWFGMFSMMAACSFITIPEQYLFCPPTPRIYNGRSPSTKHHSVYCLVRDEADSPPSAPRTVDGRGHDILLLVVLYPDKHHCPTRAEKEWTRCG
ncbi:uncharacterized protein LOC124122976 [Haliotis rufescens]|uniref:uncharacterized protein LOC124122976 n=1 Tax=Haliotis rufescens TaxID=6454 RepID=UPI00201E858B|nr:uncharacterized protein LOC124122976 [Haliotis rufescens]